jgi:hypothetical protein
MYTATRIFLVALTCLGLGGCLEVDLRGEVDANGSMTLHTDLAVPKELVDAYAGLPGVVAEPHSKKRPASKDRASGDFAAHCKDSFKTLIKQAETQWGTKRPVPKRKAATTEKAQPAAMSAFTGTYSTRAAFDVCTLSQTVNDPVAELKKELAKDQSEDWTVMLEPLPGGNGYRFAAEMRKADSLLTDASEQQRAATMMMMQFLQQKWALGLSLSGTRIENTNGTISADGRTVSWKIPLMQFFMTDRDLQTGREVQPGRDQSVQLKADIYFK